MTNKRAATHFSSRTARRARALRSAGAAPSLANRSALALRLQEVVKAHESARPESVTPSADATARVPFPYESALLGLLPEDERSALLRAVLAYGPQALQAWQFFQASVGDVEAYFEQDETGSKALLPLLEASFDRNGISAARSLRTYVRKCVQLEELRGELYESVLEECVRTLNAAGIYPLLLKSAALALTIGPQTALRAGHAIDLLVHPNQMANALDALRAAGFCVEGTGPGSAAHRHLRHPRGLAVGVHSRVFMLPQLDIPGAELRQRRRTVLVRERAMLVISPEDCLLHLCGHGLYPPGEGNLRWLCEAYYLLQLTPDLNWRQLVATAIEARLAAPLFILLRWLRDTLSVPMPLGYLAQLESASRQLDGPATEAICLSLVRSTRCWRRTSIALSGDLRQMWGLMRFGILPSTDYLRWQSNVGTAISPARLHARRLYRIVRRLAARGRGRT